MTTTTKKPSIKELLQKAKRAERVVPVCLDMSLVAEFETLERELAEANRQPSTASLAGDPKIKIARRIEAIRQQMRAASVDFRIRAMPRVAWTALVRKHPPRKGNDADANAGMNLDTFTEAMLHVCIVDPVMDDEDWAAVFGDDGVLSSAQYDTLVQVAFAVNRGDVDVPFSRAASATLRTSENE
jgi:hypothetical protein